MSGRAGSDILRPRSRVNRSARSSLNDFFGLKNDESDASVGHALRVPLPNRDETDRTLPAARTLPAPPRAAVARQQREINRFKTIPYCFSPRHFPLANGADARATVRSPLRGGKKSFEERSTRLRNALAARCAVCMSSGKGPKPWRRIATSSRYAIRNVARSRCGSQSAGWW